MRLSTCRAIFISPSVRVWDVATGREIVSLSGHDDRVDSCEWSPDGTRLASTSDDRTVRVWEANAWSEVALQEGNDDIVWLCAWSPDGRSYTHPLISAM